MDPASFTFLLLLAAGWALAKPEHARKFTRAAATGAGYAWGSTGRLPASSTADPKTKGASKGRTGSTARPATAQPTSIRQAARMGWSSGVQSALQKRSEGRTIVGRTRRAVEWSSARAGQVVTGISGLVGFIPAVREARAARKGRLEAAKTSLAQDPLAPAGGTQEKEKNVPDLTVSEMATRSDMTADTEKLKAAALLHQETEAALRAAAATFAERYEGADWGTQPINTAATAVTESASGNVLDTGALVEALTATSAALKQDEELAEVAAAQGAYGRVESHV